MTNNNSFYHNKRVLITGHTGFKGSWLAEILKNKGAVVCGYALDPPTDPSLFIEANVGEGMKSVVGDVRDYESMKAVFDDFKPEIAFHLAAQPLVRESYLVPKYTYETNVLGTVNFLECVRLSGSVKSAVVVTTDKVYYNDGSGRAFSEDDKLDGFDPYANSKSCAELVTHSYKNSFLDAAGIAASTARAGNVIGGGDFAKDRIVPDCVRAAISGTELKVRNPASVRPYQHVLEPLFVYLMIAERQWNDKTLAGYYNVGPEKEDCFTTAMIVDAFNEAWGNMKHSEKSDNAFHEDKLLSLDCEKIKRVFGWKPVWNAIIAVQKTVEWAKIHACGGDVSALMKKQIEEYESSLFQKTGIKL